MWKAIHITCSDNHDCLLRDGIQPVIRFMQAKGYIQRVYILRQDLPAPTFVIQMEVEREKDYKQALRLCRTELAAYMGNYSAETQDHQWIHERKLTLPHGLHEQEHIGELLHTFYSYTYGLITQELDRCRGQIQTKYYRVVRMIAANGRNDLYHSLITGYFTPRAKVESYMQRLREREFVSKQYEDADKYYGLIVDQALEDLLHNTNDRGVYEGNDEFLRMWSSARQQLCAAIIALDEAGLLHKIKLYSSLANVKQLIDYIMYYSMKALLPLFELDLKQQFMMEYSIIRSVERIACKDFRQFQASSHR